ncbi:hypothetical protein [Alicyclobacillus sendaiensis]|uniref:TetR family transcriptional regulator n=1 Tax=Alicyclobacillus sendaiensis PA2 TaxID=3029425 RepID=A0ABT6XWQ2_ALISE|nr:hypothetical protein [Alicyclobacillus sendaiensis]MDI9259525.1 hypothetical protein [Alicyclobacillus sendaiensis PA2]
MAQDTPNREAREAMKRTVTAKENRQDLIREIATRAFLQYDDTMRRLSKN